MTLDDPLSAEPRHELAAQSHGVALNLAVRTGDRSREASAVLGLGEVLATTGQPHEAHTHYSAAIAIAQGIEEPLLEARGHADLASGATASGDVARARDHLRQSLRIYENLASPKADAIRQSLAELDNDEPTPSEATVVGPVVAFP